MLKPASPDINAGRLQVKMNELVPLACTNWKQFRAFTVPVLISPQRKGHHNASLQTGFALESVLEDRVLALESQLHDVVSK